MKIVIALELEPFAKEEVRLTWAKTLALRAEKAGHDPHIVRLPFARGNDSDITQSFLAMRLLVIRNADRLVVIDHLVGAVQHPCKTGWIMDKEPYQRQGASTSLNSKLAALLVADCQKFIVNGKMEDAPLLQGIVRGDKPCHAISDTICSNVSESEWESIIKLIAA